MDLQTLKIGSRVRCTDDGVAGRIVWANAASVKIRWDDGEQVTWRRDALNGKPIEIVDAAGGEERAVAPTACEQTDPIGLPQAEREVAAAAPAAGEEPSAPEQPVVEPPADPAATESAPAEQLPGVSSAETTEVPEAVAVGQTSAEDTQAEEAPPSEGSRETHTPPQQAVGQPEAHSAAAKRTRTRKRKQAVDGDKDKRLSALDAAAKVLAETGQAMTCQELIAAMAAKGYWTSPGGKTPQATLYSAIAREITTKCTDSRFVKTQRGKFARIGAG
jgi:hypothetical protein